MGISSMSSPSDGILCLILVTTAISIVVVKGVVRSFLQVVGINLPSDSEIELSLESDECRGIPSDSYMDAFRHRTPAVRFDSVAGGKWAEQECCVCLRGFEPHSEINSLSCGHLFHKMCLERWLNYWNVTCPLCRTPFMPEEEAAAEESGDETTPCA
ncbi:probable E3 ubiquitin-protein ligase XERICO [Malania oleifera]|uniref:probable E3 ubiquitin-protein ligase XERICO n=1 Tax=Malania oleifera TaxID=397392 RepID=UPI0025AEB90D|nr:probable E3 ubiquitin-protein ligase XERICO [Malania oleifera]